MDGAFNRQRILNRSEWAAARKRAIASLDPVCAICHLFIDISLPKKDPITGVWNDLAVEVDHKLARANGGAMYELSNLQLTHSRCNRKKGSKLEIDTSDTKPGTNPFPLSRQW